ncbi:MAG TPA: peptide chain release factor N(5)-glutamine methyltransferase, partial [Kocuria sp.]|nr:peptide chain release factor N(5)-glutamine methyltransferase [Kocuria sp.]
MGSTLAQAIAWARAELTAAGVASPDNDAALLAAHALGLPRGQTEARAILGSPEPEGYR